MQDKAKNNTISNVSNISVWLSNKLSGNDLWINGGSICSQLNKEALRNIKEIFTDLQTQVKLKLLLSFFHIPRRLIDEWKTELDEILEVAAQDQELWVSMLSESMKTYPATGSLNTEISDYDHNESRPIFTDMVSELKRLVNKTNDLRMLPLECQYLNKPALIALVGNQPAPLRHFVLKRKPKSTILRTELMQKSADAQSSLKKTSAPTVPLRSRGLPRKMTDTTPLKGIPSRVPSSGFKTPASVQSKNASRTTPAGRKDGGVKFLEIEDQPLGYAAAKKRKRQQELEEQAKRAAENEQNAKAGEVNVNQTSVQTSTTTVTPDYAAGLAHYSQPATPMPSVNDSAMVSTSLFTSTTQSITTSTASSPTAVVTNRELKKENSILSPKRMKFEDDIEEVKATSPIKQQELPVKSIVMAAREGTTKGETKIVRVTKTLPTLISNTNAPKSIVLTPTTSTIASPYVTIKAVSAPNASNQPNPLSHLNIPSNTIVRTVQYVTTQAQQQNAISSNTITTKSPTAVTAIQKPTLIAKTNAAGKPTILSNIVLTPNNIRSAVPQQQQQQTSTAPGTTSYVISSPSNKIVQRVVVSSGQNISIPTLSTRTAQPTIIQPIQQQGTPTKIVQIKTTPTILGVNQNSSMQNIPPLVSTQPPTLLNIQNIQNATRKTVSLPGQQQQVTTTQQGQKVNQIIVPGGGVVKGKTIIVSNQNQNLNLGQRNVILQSVGAGGGSIYQQIPISSVPSSNVPQLVLANSNAQTGQQQQTQQTVPRLITNITPIGTQQQSANHVQIRPVLTGLQQGGQLTLIQRPGQQAQLVQAAQIMQPQTIQKTIITRPQIVQVQQTQQQAAQQNQGASQGSTGTTIKIASTAANTTTGQRRGLSLSSKHVAVASEMFKKANRVTRLDKALILGFMAGYRDNPRPNADNVITIKLNESKEQVKQPDNTVVPMLVDTLIRLDYNTGEWKTFRTFRKITQQQQAEAATAAPQQQSQSSVVI
ncbi:hypothetical protein PVAND_001953 [Polypedilum vanderplanki]|uniref:HDAg domain-containing protein n=1 Tax=Polypedilum vanderplanki TaxID=319348 RepID=A0A9J6BPY6_POLVA|nr:hypothetical protein PVAND_001953 [Polypedilum vanderplanki]